MLYTFYINIYAHILVTSLPFNAQCPQKNYERKKKEEVEEEIWAEGGCE